ncbi:MAG: SDR family oxidoreductase [Bacteroidales bacterium]|nr:SDR family oxidoreductase [Bacteroidales bacterium]
MGTCIITGIGSGIGKATAIMLASQGFYSHYALIGRNDEDMRQTQAEMQRCLPEGCTRLYHIDLAYPEQIPDLVAKIDAEVGDIEALLNIAGYTDPQSLLTTTLESFELTYKVNVYAPFMFMRECVKYMRQKGGKILNVASTAGMTPRPGWLSYASSKSAVISMSETLTAELSEYGIMVYCVSPGRCATKLRKRLAPDEDPTTIMQPEEVAQVICNLVNPNEHCLDGQNIVIRKSVKK